MLKRKLSAFWEANKILFACAALPALIMLAVYFGRGVFPVGNHSVLALDLNAQYIYYYEAFRQAVWEGKSILYSWSQSLSGEMIGIFGYYLASPFMIIYLLFPKGLIVEALLVVTLLKAASLGASFAFFLRRTTKLSDLPLLIMSTLYALMAYTVVQAMNPMWIDAVILLPLIALGLQYFIDEGKFALFFVTLTLALFINYYIGYMLCIYCILHFLYYYFAKPRDGGWKTFVAKGAGFAGLGILCVLAACVMLLPIYLSLQNGKLDFSDPDYSLSLRFSLFNLLPKLLFDSYDSVNVQGMPFIYCGTLTLFLVPAFFCAPGISIRKKAATAGLITVLFAIMNISILDIGMHGFRIPNWLNYRYSFVFSFVLLNAAAHGFDHLQEIPRDKFIKTYGFLLIFVALIQLSQFEYIDNFTCIWISILLISLYALFLCLASNPLNATRFTQVLALIVVAELTANTALLLQDIHTEVVFSDRTTYVPFIAESREAVAQVTEFDDDFYRMEKTYHRTVNDPMALGIAGLSHSTSTLNARALDFIDDIGYNQREHWSRYTPNTIVADSLLGFRYILTKDQKLETFYEPVLTSGDITACRNPYALPIVFAAATGFDEEIINSSNPINFQCQLVTALTGENYMDLFTPIQDFTRTLSGVTESTYGSHKRFTSTGKMGSITFTVNVDRDGPVYAYFPTDYRDTCALAVNGETLTTLFGNETQIVVWLGDYKAGDIIDVSLTVTGEQAYIRNATSYFYSLDVAAWEEAYAKLSRSPLELTRRTETFMQGTMTVYEDNTTVFTSIPYEGGWTIKIDGEPVEVKIGADSLVCFDVPVGDHEIEMSFCPPGLKEGAVISAAAIVLFALLVVYRKKCGRQV